MESEKGPILSKWHKGEETEDKRIGGGFVSDEVGKKQGVRRKKFETVEGEKAYVYKEVLDKEDAKQTIQIYQTFKEAGLPIVGFAKIIRKKVNDNIEYSLAMEDLTENGVYSVVEVRQRVNGKVISELIATSENPKKLQEDMIKALAVIHNNGIYDYHPDISFAIRLYESENEMGVSIKDFKIIDYANFEEKKEGKDGEFEFHAECLKDLDRLLNSICSDEAQVDRLKKLYFALREKEITKYN